MRVFLLFFMLGIGFCFSNNSYSQSTKISLHLKNKTVKQVLSEIEKNSEFIFFYQDDILDADRKVTVNVDNGTIEEILNEILCATGNTYFVSDRSIYIIKEASDNIAGENIDQQQKRTITGRITDKEGESIIGANIIEKGTTNGTVTDIDGKFSLQVENDAVLHISFIGYLPQEINTEGKITFNIVLQEDTKALEEVVVVGFGTQKKASVTGAISTVSAKALRVPTSTLSNAFSGRIAGVVSVQRGSEPGADGSNFWIRGISTFAGSSQPLIFIDGVESSSADMNNLAPEVIDNFSVLKDASATALYGARGANGVILIMTKRGGDLEKARINVRVENTVSAPIQPVKLANAVDYMNIYNYALTNRGLPARFDEETKIKPTQEGIDPIAYPDVDWYGTLFKDYTMNQYANMNISGGGKKADYFISATFNRDNGILRKDPFNNFDNNLRITKYNLVGNIGVNITNTTKAVVRLNTRLEDYNGANVTTERLYANMFEAPPALFAPVLPNTIGADHILFGNIQGGPHPTGTGSNIYRNPYADMVSGYRTNFNNTSTASIDVTHNLAWLLEGLTVQALVSFKMFSQTNKVRTTIPFYYEIRDFDYEDGVPNYTYQSISKGTTALSSSFSSWGDRLFNTNLILNWGRRFGEHGVSAMLTYLTRDYSPSNPSNLVASLPQRNQGVAGRVTYEFRDRYFFEGNFGYNGNENFAKGNRFGFFPSLSVGYTISREDFWESLFPFISNLKVRGSWGIVGNADIYDVSGNRIRFPYLDELNLSSIGYTFGDNWQTKVLGPSFSKIGAQGATWEEGEKVNIGLDLGFLNNRITLTADGFKEDRTGVFMQRRLIPAEAGIVGQSPYANIGRMRNQGFDANVSYQENLTKDLYVNFRGTFTYAKNTLLDYDEPKTEFPFQSQLGRPWGVREGYIAEGYYKDADDVANSPRSTLSQNLMPGDIKYKDLDGNGQIDAFDKTWIGYPEVPQIVYGFGASVQYKKFDASFFFQGAAQTSIFMSGMHPFSPSESSLLQYIADDYWTETNTDAMYPRLISKFDRHHNFETSTHWMKDGSFLRLKNAEIGYTHKFARIFISGQNLLTFSSFKYWDVELGSGNGLRYPNSRIISLGAQLNF